MDWRTIRRLAMRRWVGLLLVGLIVLTVRAQVLGRLVRDRSQISSLDNPMAVASTVGRVLTPVVLLGKYVGLMIWPDPLCHDYSYNALPVCETVADPRFVWGLVCMAGMAAGAIVSLRGRGRVLWAVGFFVLTYVMVSNSVVLAGTIFAERLIYLPLASYCWVVATAAVAVVDWVRRRGIRRSGWWVVVPVFAILCGAYGYLGARRGAEWRSERSLIASGLRLTNESARLQMQAGAYALMDGDRAEAIRRYGRALEIRPGDASAHFWLGRLYYQMKEPATALEHLSAAFEGLPTEFQGIDARLLESVHRKLGHEGEADRWRVMAEKIEAHLRGQRGG